MLISDDEIAKGSPFFRHYVTKLGLLQTNIQISLSHKRRQVFFDNFANKK
jgi:hypothetical protein